MSPVITQKLANEISISEQKENKRYLIWHGGEPLSCGLAHFKNLVTPFDQLRVQKKIAHNIQTNATLITQEWCDFFIEHEVSVGVSIDGPKWANNLRIDWNGRMAFSRVMQGIDLLKLNRIPFTVIAVVNEQNLRRAKEFYDFFCDLGCTILGINIEEIEGVNKRVGLIIKKDVKLFWQELFDAWQQKPVIKIREFERSFAYMKSIISGQTKYWDAQKVYPLPTITWNGNVILLSPELAGVQSHQYNNFVVGNITHQSLEEIVASGKKSEYVVDFADGVRKCKQKCQYFGFCGGGHASNKFAEHGSLTVTETSYCINTKQILLDVMIAKAREVVG